MLSLTCCFIYCCRYPYNNFLHHHVENIILSCLESKNARLTEHLLHECDLVGKILEAENNFTLTNDPNKVLLKLLLFLCWFLFWLLFLSEIGS